MKTFYIIAVSGGVDSVVLLHKLASKKPENILYVVAHVDHGIRPDSAEDAAFVQSLAKKYGYAYEQTELRLGEHASEDTARKARYEFLFSLMKKYKAESIITAHHQDDVVETMIVNILRGTGARGLVGFTRRGVLRPLINKTKKELVEYAKEHKLTWREDSTNSDESYLRNYVRSHFLPKLGSKRQQLLDIRIQAHEQVQEINELTKKLLVNSMRKGELVRARFVVLPFSVQKEVVAMWLRLHDIPFDAATIDRLTLAAKTLAAGKQVDITKTARLDIGKETISLKKL